MIDAIILWLLIALVSTPSSFSITIILHHIKKYGEIPILWDLFFPYNLLFERFPMIYHMRGFSKNLKRSIVFPFKWQFQNIFPNLQFNIYINAYSATKNQVPLVVVHCFLNFQQIYLLSTSREASSLKFVQELLHNERLRAS